MSEEKKHKNVFGEPILSCCHDPVTGYYRSGSCEVDRFDVGNHSVCALMTQEFLEFSKEQGNDLITPKEEFGFPGLKEGDRWCLCASRWKEALDAGKAPKVYLAATHEKSLEVIDLGDLKNFAMDWQ